MKLRLSLSLLTLLLAGPALGGIASKTVRLDWMEPEKVPTYDDFDSGMYYDCYFDVRGANIDVGGNLDVGKWDDVYIYWNTDEYMENYGDSRTTYTMSGKGKVGGFYQEWHLGQGTYEFNGEVTPGSDAFVWNRMGDCHVVINAPMTIGQVVVSTVTINSSNVKIYEAMGIDDLYSSYVLTSKNLNGLLSGGASNIYADVELNGNAPGYTPLDLRILGGSTMVYGNVNFKSKTSYDFFIQPPYSPGYDCGGWHTKPDADSINEQLAELDGEVMFSCKSYTGNLANMALTLWYSKAMTDRWGCYLNETKLGSGSAYGAFVPLYNEADTCYDIVFKSYALAQYATDLAPSSYNAQWGLEYDLTGDLYVNKAFNLSPTGAATLYWDAMGESVCMMGKGAISAKQGLMVVLSDGCFSLMPSSSFKNADYYLDYALLTGSSALSANSMVLAERSYLALPGSKLTVKYDFELQESSVADIGAAVSAGSLSMGDKSYLYVEAPKAVNLDLKDKYADNSIDDSHVTVAGKMSVAGNLELWGNSSIRLYDPSGSNKPMALTVKGNLYLGGNSMLTLSGALSAKNLYLDGGTINLTGSKLQTIKVSNALTINTNYVTDINYNFTVTQADVAKGKAFKIITFKSANDALYEYDYYYGLESLFGLEDAGCTLYFDKKGTSIMLTVYDLYSWRRAMLSDEELAAEPTAVTAPVHPVLPDYSGVADALVQADWGLVESSRAFVNTIANRSMAVQLGSGERAVWASAIAGSSRRSSSGTHGGADTNITGGAIGMETQLGENSLLGMALGNSWTRVSAHNYGTIKQDTTHLGIYGQTNWNKLSADWSAAYGRSESKFNGSDWSQKAIQLDGRLSYNHALSETVLLRGFGGVQYYASDSARVDGIDTGEVQNLRGEIGVGIVRSTYKSSVYAELALHQDLVRDNPEVRSPFGQRYHGTNPGRTGINLTIGGSYALSDQWSVNASYTAEVVENANAHSVNVGATYKF